MKLWTAALGLILLLTLVDIYQSDRRHQDDLNGLSMHGIDVHEQMSAGMAASSDTLAKFKDCPICRVGHYYGRILQELGDTEYPAPPVLETGAVSEWAYALGLALAEKAVTLELCSSIRLRVICSPLRVGPFAKYLKRAIRSRRRNVIEILPDLIKKPAYSASAAPVERTLSC